MEGLDNEQYSFNDKPNVYDMAQAFFHEFEEQEAYFPLPLLVKKYQETAKYLKLLICQANGRDFPKMRIEDMELTKFQGEIVLICQKNYSHHL